VKNVSAVQPLSAKAYALMAVVGLVIAVGFTLFYIYQVPRLVQSGSQGQVFYVLLLPWSLSCAAFLFGAMRSYARLTYKHLGGFLELGGPVVLFCLVLVGGFKLVPPAPETFDLTVRAHSEDGRNPIITSGKITIDFDANRIPVLIDAKGEANFKSIPTRFKGATLRVLPEFEGYEEKPQELKLEGQVLDLALEREHPVIVLTGSIVPAPGPHSTTKILVDGQEGESSVDEFGRFRLNVSGKAGDRVRVKAFRDGKLVFDDYEVLPGPVTLSMKIGSRKP
jgi:hypothetical protein